MRSIKVRSTGQLRETAVHRTNSSQERTVGSHETNAKCKSSLIIQIFCFQLLLVLVSLGKI